MLKQRVATAIVLLIVLALALTLAAPWGFPLLAGGFVMAAVWEWLRLAGFAQAPALVAAVLVGGGLYALHVLGGATAATPAGRDPAMAGRILMAIAALIWCALAARLVLARRFFGLTGQRPVLGAAGLLLVAACWVAMAGAYASGIVYLVSIMSLVWAADIAAYFAGRAFGRHKLAPAISPNKTWEGVAGGVVAVWLVAGVCAAVPALADSFYARALAALPLAGALALFTFLTGMSIVGDLFESHLKREAGVKDSSQLLPGHGGVLDRIDALLPVLPLAVLIGQGW